MSGTEAAADRVGKKVNVRPPQDRNTAFGRGPLMGRDGAAQRGQQ
ncbi:hypothetical protein [Chelatococcus composti]|jgi:hypothetical protein|uniref:Uncharacterized protein n=1 Tax=Chelatococcus composti TaxID=1743235 RepID=A0A841K9D5_9HYPH|nr:hypothetical protein [Chelatococcus composti]MBB6167494.1 hypothetical protein [Chelatococcus composti]